ncbi:MAG: O-antigen ligase family protein [Ruegeria sp.]|uniref:O-antigen ligase family protein n=1 Tax=Ruegeria sp. TaxID=1879320 RepID=UPI00349EAD38
MTDFSTTENSTPYPGPASSIELTLAMITVFLAPLNYLRASFVYFTLGDVFAFSTFILMLTKGRLPLRPFGAISGLWFASVLMFLTGFMMGSILNGDPIAGTTAIGQYCVTLILMPMIILQRSRRETELLILAFVASICVSMIHGAYYVNYYPDDGRFVSINGRLKGLVERVNGAGAMAAFAITFLTWLRYVGRIHIILFLLLLSPIVYGLLLTGSNTGFYLTAIGVFGLAVLSGSARAIIKLLSAMIALFAVALLWGDAFLPEVFQERVFEAVRAGDASESGTFDERFMLILEAQKIADDTVWLGLGIDQYEEVSALDAPVHNTYLLTLSEGGLMSLLGLVGMLLTGIYIAWFERFFRHNWINSALSLSIVVMVALVMNAIPHFYARFWTVPWMLALSVSLMPVTISARSRTRIFAKAEQQ